MFRATAAGLRYFSFDQYFAVSARPEAYGAAESNGKAF
jgi:hypothetical protein